MVTATRSEVPLTDVIADVSIIDSEAIERSGATGVGELLSRLPGMTTTNSGGQATPTSVFVRGAENRFTAVFIDGVRVDSQSSGGASWEVIPLSQVDRIEVLRGSAAAIYGSDAVAGVVQIFTKQGEKGFFPSVSFGLGTNNTRDVNAALRGGTDEVDYAFSVAERRSDGFNAKPVGNPDRDGYRSLSFSGRLGWNVQPGQKLELTLLDNDQKSAYDTSANDDQTQHHLQTLGLNWTARWSDVWNTRVSATRGTDHYETSPSPYVTDTVITTYLFRNEWHLGAGLLTADLERREDQLENANTTPTTTHRSQDALALGYGLRSGKHTLQMNARRDDDSEFGGQTTGSLAYGYDLSPSVRLTAAKSTAFRVPTLFQRFSIYGTPNLKAETSDNKEVGLRWQSGVHHASVVAYHNDVENLINYVAGPGTCPNGSDLLYPGCYGNTGRARMTGSTLAGGTQLGGVNLDASVDWMTPTNLDTGMLLARRPRKQATVTLDAPVGDWRLGAEVHYVGERFDDARNLSRLAPYNLINVTASTQITRDWRLLARVNNVSDKEYVLAKGYATEGRTVYLGLTWSPK